MILLIDNFDSFVYNLARYFERLGQPTQVVRNDRVDEPMICSQRPEAIVLSPGPCAPQQAGCCLDITRRFAGEIPLLGICLGHQIIAEAFGARVQRSREPMHGRTSLMLHDGRGVFQGVPSPFTACRYHSLVIPEESLPSCLEVSSRCGDGTVMGIRHRHECLVGLQFHPEAILTEYGYRILANFLALAQLDYNSEIAQRYAEWERPIERRPWSPRVPVTF